MDNINLSKGKKLANCLASASTGYSFYLDSDFTKIAAISVGEIICESWRDLVNVDLCQFFVQIDGILSKTLKENY